MSERKFVVFNLADERYALDVSHVETILPEAEVTPIPRSPKFFMGVFNMRGETIPAVDLRKRMEMPNSSSPGNFVVMESVYGRVGLRVDRVDGIVVANEEDLESPHQQLINATDPFIKNILRQDETLTVVLNPDELIPASGVKALEKARKVAA